MMGKAHIRRGLPIHHDTHIWLLRFCMDLRTQVESGKSPRLGESRLGEWQQHRQGLEQCGSIFLDPETRSFVTDKHCVLIAIVSKVVVALKLETPVTLYDIEAIERLLPELDECREKIEWY